MRALAIVHQADAGPGVFADVFGSRDAELDQWLIAEGPPPADPLGYDAVLTLGGAMHADQGADHPWLAEEKSLLAELIDRRVPLLGMCLGCQLVAEAGGASARRASAPEIGWQEVELRPDAAGDPVLSRLPPTFEAFLTTAATGPGARTTRDQLDYVTDERGDVIVDFVGRYEIQVFL